jgi:hypothetical protein
MFYDKKKKQYFTETSGDREWVQKAWGAFVIELFKTNSVRVEELLKEWNITLSEAHIPFIAYPKSYLKRNPRVKKERDLRDKLARQTGEAYDKILKVRGKK